MDPSKDLENIDDFDDLTDESMVSEADSVDDFIRQLEEKERDLHITADTTFIEIAEAFDSDDEMPEAFVAALKNANRHSDGIDTLHAANRPVSDTAALNEIGLLTDKIEKMEAERSEMFKNSHRRAKDFEVYKARTERERSETFNNQVANLATRMLPALDNLNRALDFALKMSEEKRREIEDFFEGIMLVNHQINDIMAGMGVLPIATVGCQFDPHLHEAVAIKETSEQPNNMIFEEVLRGYSMGEKIIRHSMVKVAKNTGSEISNQAFESSDASIVAAAPEKLSSLDETFELETFQTPESSSDS